MAESLSGVIERVTAHHPDTGFAVLRVLCPGRRGEVTVVGNLPTAVAGEYIEATGSWVQHREYGLQFQADSLRTTPPHTAAGIARYLGSGLVKGIGPHFARKIVEVFGERTLEVIDESPAFLREVKGIGARRLQRIRESWQQQKAVRGIMVFLQSHGLGTARAVRIWKTYGSPAVELVRANPYRLATDIWGVGFQTADDLAARLGIARDSPQRARAAVRYVLQQLSSEGHVGFPEQAVLEKTADLTGIDLPVVAAAVEEGKHEGELVREPWPSAGHAPSPLPSPVSADSLPPTDEPWLYLKPLFLAEVGVTRGLASLTEGGHPLGPLGPERTEAALDWVEKRMGLTLAPSQREAVRQALTHKLLVITGGPGVGKTTIVRGILEVFAAKGRTLLLCAPTGRAARRLQETTGREAKTIHRLLEFDPSLGGFKRDRHAPLDADLVVVDEVSMVDVALMNRLVQAVPAHACLVLVGDVDQLPSVGPGRVLADIIASSAIPVARLTEIFRQAGQSWIVRAAHAVNRGELPETAPPGGGDFYLVEADTPDRILDRILLLVRQRIPDRFGLDPLADIQVLTPMNRSELGSRALNARLQDALNPDSDAPRVERYGWTFRPGDKVLQTQNDYDKDVFNGDIGRVADVDLQEQELTVEFDGRRVTYDFGELDELALAYACTIHKSQGSEYPAVVIPLHSQHHVMLQRNLLYTGITRGKKLVVLVGSKKALATAVRNRDSSLRFSGLHRRLRAKEE